MYYMYTYNNKTKNTKYISYILIMNFSLYYTHVDNFLDESAVTSDGQQRTIDTRWIVDSGNNVVDLLKYFSMNFLEILILR